MWRQETTSVSFLLPYYLAMEAGGSLAVSAELYAPSYLAHEPLGNSPLSASHFAETGQGYRFWPVHPAPRVGFRVLTQVVRHGKFFYQISSLTDLQHTHFESALVGKEVLQNGNLQGWASAAERCHRLTSSSLSFGSFDLKMMDLHLIQRPADTLCQRPDYKYFRLCGPYSLCCEFLDPIVAWHQP